MDDLKREESGSLVSLHDDGYEGRISTLKASHRRFLEQEGRRAELDIMRCQVKYLIGLIVELQWRKSASNFFSALSAGLTVSSLPLGSVFCITAAVLAGAGFGLVVRNNRLSEFQCIEALSKIIDRIWAMEQAGQVNPGTTTAVFKYIHSEVAPECDFQTCYIQRRGQLICKTD